MEHKGSKDTFEHIGAAFVHPDFFFSTKDRWDRMGFLGVFADYACSSVSGNIGEVGCGESSIYLSHVARKYRRHMFHCDIAPDKIINPLTIPGYMLKDAAEVKLEDGGKKFYKDDSMFFLGSSDDFLKEFDAESFALIFIDGDHNYIQAKKDFENAMPLVVENGFILLHDTYPPSEEYLCPDSKCGDVYKLRLDLKKDPRVDVMTLTRGTAMGVGLTICRKKPKTSAYFQEG